MKKPLDERIRDFAQRLNNKAFSMRRLGGHSGAATYEEIADELRKLLDEYHEESGPVPKGEKAG